jgi:hypothetical protein
MEAVAIKGRGISGGDSDGAVKSMMLDLPLRVSLRVSIPDENAVEALEVVLCEAGEV